MQLKDLITKTINFTPQEVDNFDSLFTTTCIGFDASTSRSLVLCYNKSCADTDFIVALKEKNTLSLINDFTQLLQTLELLEPDDAALVNQEIAKNPRIFNALSDLREKQVALEMLEKHKRKKDTVVSQLNKINEVRFNIDSDSLNQDQIDYINLRLHLNGYDPLSTKVFITPPKELSSLSNYDNFPIQDDLRAPKDSEFDEYSYGYAVDGMETTCTKSIVSIFDEKDPSKSIITRLRVELESDLGDSISFLLPGESGKTDVEYFEALKRILLSTSNWSIGGDQVFSYEQKEKLLEVVATRDLKMSEELKQHNTWLDVNFEKHALNTQLSTPKDKKLIVTKI